MVDPAIVIEPYDAQWPRDFAHERSRLTRAFNADAVIEHVGSTAVPGLGAKPIIDIMVGLATLAEAESRIPAMKALGYEYVADYETALPDRRYFRRPRNRPRTHHVHCVVRGAAFWCDHLVFREYLRRHPEAVEAYLDLKRDLAARHGSNRAAYIQGKSTFIENVLARAAAEGLGAA